jgi:hypothetical protein
LGQDIDEKGVVIVGAHEVFDGLGLAESIGASGVFDLSEALLKSLEDRDAVALEFLIILCFFRHNDLDAQVSQFAIQILYFGSHFLRKFKLLFWLIEVLVLSLNNSL